MRSFLRFIAGTVIGLDGFALCIGLIAFFASLGGSSESLTRIETVLGVTLVVFMVAGILWAALDVADFLAKQQKLEVITPQIESGTALEIAAYSAKLQTPEEAKAIFAENVKMPSVW